MEFQPRNCRLSLQTSFTMTLQVDAKQAASKAPIFKIIVICKLLAKPKFTRPNLHLQYGDKEMGQRTDYPNYQNWADGDHQLLAKFANWFRCFKKNEKDCAESFDNCFSSIGIEIQKSLKSMSRDCLVWSIEQRIFCILLPSPENEVKIKSLYSRVESNEWNTTDRQLIGKLTVFRQHLMICVLFLCIGPAAEALSPKTTRPE